MPSQVYRLAFVSCYISIDITLLRCYIVYSRRWRVLIPSLILYLGGVGMGIKLIEAQVSLNHANATMNSPEIHPWWFALFCITVVGFLSAPDSFESNTASNGRFRTR
jgi:hypothetical protein